ncbi:unnamed protein product [Caenorhabditis brenneri]
MVHRSKARLQLGREFTVSSFVTKNSMVQELEGALEQEVKKTQEELREIQEQERRKITEEKAENWGE